MIILARDLRYTLRYARVMASLMKAIFGSSSSTDATSHSNLAGRVQPHAHDPTLAWDKLKVKQIVKRLAYKT